MKLLYKIPLCLFLCVSLSSVLFAQEDPEESTARVKVSSLEKRGDVAYIKGKYDSATKLYERASERLQEKEENDAWLRMELKLARVYNTLQDYENVVTHYKLILDTDKLVLEVDDVCSYVDALLILGQNYEAELVARQFYFIDSFRNSRRYNNTINALANLRKYGMDGSNVDATPHSSANTENAEYWVYDLDGQLFYAVSDSPVIDSRKLAFHHTRFVGLDDDNSSKRRKKSFRNIPPEIQNGPSSNYGDYWIVTVIEYISTDRIGMGEETFRTRLYYTVRDQKRRGWTNPQPLFDYTGDLANYAHPALFNEGKSLIFSSNMQGGHGGMDLYISHLDEETGTWSRPVNLGAYVNTDGDEIFPDVIDDKVLNFASNGLQGYGGFNVYGARISGNRIEPASTYQYPASVNSHYNDLALYVQDGNAIYLTSDRSGAGYRENIYSLKDEDDDFMSMSADRIGLSGNLALINDLSANDANVRTDVVPVETKFVLAAGEGDVLVRVYFNFDRSDLTAESIATLQSLLNDPRLGSVRELMVVGYADEIGSDAYNLRLSQRRAREVAGYLFDNGTESEISWEGRGRTTPDEDDYNRQLEEMKNQAKRGKSKLILSFRDRIKLNRTARRVDVIVRKEK